MTKTEEAIAALDDMLAEMSLHGIKDCPEADAIRNHITSLEAEVERLRKLVYAPGVWRCAKCDFTLLQSNLNMNNGTVTARDEPGTKCPNDGAPMWRVSWADQAKERGEDLDRIFDEKIVLQAERDSLKAQLVKADEVISKCMGLFNSIGAVDMTRDLLALLIDARSAAYQYLKGREG